MVPVARALFLVLLLSGALSAPRIANGADIGADDCGTMSEPVIGVGGPIQVDASAGADVPSARVIPDAAAVIPAARTAMAGSDRLQQSGWEPVDSLSAHVMIPAGERYEIRVDSALPRLREIRPPDSLSELSRQAVQRAPLWLVDPLTDNLGRLGSPDQDVFAQLILDAEDPWVDEVAFQVARMAPASLTHELFTPALITENARLIYEHDQVLQYVDVVDYGSAEAGGDYYSTTKYRIADGEYDEWLEIPANMYYWFVVQPKLSDETAKSSAEASSRQATYGYFWREYLFSNPDESHDYTAKDGETGFYPLLSEVLAQPTVFWDLQKIDLPKLRPFEEGDVALDVVGNWVGHVLPEKAKGNRPVQPNQIAYEHNGNCGEIQDLLGAAARTGLIPATLTSDHCEDHVWNEFFSMTPDLGGWHPYQVSWEAGPTHIDNPGIAYDRDHGGGKDVSAIWAFRPDGYIYDVVDRYSKSCTFIAEVQDRNGKPVDGARVMLASEAWGSDDQLTVANWCYTDSFGTCTFGLGDNQNYYMQVSSSIGNVPPEDNKVQSVIRASEADKTYETTVTLPGALPSSEFTVDGEEGVVYELRVEFVQHDEIVYGANLFGEAPEFAWWSGPGQLDVFLLDGDELARYQAGEPFTAAVGEEDVYSGEIVFRLPHLRSDWHLLFSNEDGLVNTSVLDAEITLAWDSVRGPGTRAFVPLAGKPAVSGMRP